MTNNGLQEDKALKFSIISLVTFSLMGILFGTLLSSEVIFFDGIFSLIGVLSSLATLKISHFLHKKDHFNFPFGKENLEPVVVIIQYMVLSAVLGYTLFDAIKILLNGGNQVELAGVILYLFVSTGMVVFVVYRLKKIAKNSHSTLIDSELLQWDISLKQSICTLAGYIVSFILVLLSYTNILPYVDPVLLIVFVIFTFVTVIKEMLAAFKEIIGMKSISSQFQKDIEDKVKQIVKTYHIKNSYLRLNKIGSVVVIEVDFLVDKEFEFGNVYQQDEIREQFEKSLSHIEYELWLSIAFTTQYKWIT